MANEQSPALSRTQFVHGIVLTHKLTDKLKYLRDVPFGWEEGAALNSAGQVTDAEWCGITQYLTYDINPQWAVGCRFEWFRDDDGVRVIPLETNVSAGAGSYYELTAGMNWKPREDLVVRPEARWDWATGDIKPFDDLSDTNQFLFAVDVVWLF